MHAFLFAHVHLVWRFLHWVHGFFYDWTTFTFVLLLGVGQTLIAWNSGNLAVKGVEDKLPKTTRTGHFRFFAISGIGLLLITIGVGYLNDRNQHQAEVKTNESVAREQNLQTTLNQQGLLIAKTDLQVARAIETARQGGSADKVVGQLEQIQRSFDKALEPKVAPVTTDRFASMSDGELSDKVRRFSSDLFKKSRNLLRLSDNNYDAQRPLEYWAQQRKPVPPQIAQNIADSKKAYQDFMNNIVEQDFPLATEYRKLLLARLGPRAKLAEITPQPKIVEFPQPVPTEPSINGFLAISSNWLNTWANQLSPAPSPVP